MMRTLAKTNYDIPEDTAPHGSSPPHKVLLDASNLPGQFLLKDVVLLGAAGWSLGDALDASAPVIRGTLSVVL
jgi:hypothetical protein